SLMENGSGGLYNFIFRNANIGGTRTGDVAVNIQRMRTGNTPFCLIAHVGDIRAARGIDEYDTSAFNVVQRFGDTSVGSLGDFSFTKRRGPSIGRPPSWKNSF